jgi:5,5'-dehydrodivanillate O-demethylase
LLPSTLRLTQPWPSYKLRWPRYSAIWKIPVDDHHTIHFSVVFTPYVNGKAPELPEGLTFDITDELTVHRLQDYQAIISQGQIYDRTQERIGSSDGGIILLRKIIREGIEAVQRGEDPKGVWRAPAMDRILDCTETSTDTTFKTAVA